MIVVGGGAGGAAHDHLLTGIIDKNLNFNPTLNDPALVTIDMPTFNVFVNDKIITVVGGVAIPLPTVGAIPIQVGFAEFVYWYVDDTGIIKQSSTISNQNDRVNLFGGILVNTGTSIEFLSPVALTNLLQFSDTSRDERNKYALDVFSVGTATLGFTENARTFVVSEIMKYAEGINPVNVTERNFITTPALDPATSMTIFDKTTKLATAITVVPELPADFQWLDSMVLTTMSNNRWYYIDVFTSPRAIGIARASYEYIDEATALEAAQADPVDYGIMSTDFLKSIGRIVMKGQFGNGTEDAQLGSNYHFVAKNGVASGGGGAVVAQDGFFYKADSSTVAFVKNGAGLDVKAGTKVWQRNGTVKEYVTDTAIIVPASFPIGMDYAIYVCDDDTIRIDPNFTAPNGYTVANSRKIGGFSKGTLPNEIIEYSLWDLKFRPACNNPRGMTLVADHFWADIYLCGINPDLNGTSHIAVTIADGFNLPTKPLKFGGNGVTTYGSFKQYDAHELMSAYGKRLPTYSEFTSLAYGVIEETSRGSEPVSTQHDSGFKSKWGVEQATGCMWQWGADIYSEGSGEYSTDGRGSMKPEIQPMAFGGGGSSNGSAGSRASWSGFPMVIDGPVFGARGVCDHFRGD